MKDKEKQISKNKEINNLANTLYNRQHKYDLSNPFEVAKCVIDLGYRKIPKDSVVLSREEYEELKQAEELCKLKNEEINDLANANVRYGIALENKSKETAEKILFNFESAFAYYDNEDMFSKKSIFECLEKIVKSCGVEIKE